MDDAWIRFSHDLIERTSGPMKFRLILQPAMAALFAIHAGLKDARSGRPPYFWGMLTDAAHRKYMARDGWKDVGKVFILALLLDVVYQVIVEHFIYPMEALVVALVLAIVPYLLLRGLVARIAAASSKAH